MLSYIACFAAMLVSSLALAAGPTTRPAYLFSSFRGNGEDGLHLAASTDGYHWTALNDDRSFLKPEVGGKLMRDPSLLRGPDGIFRLVWTTSWTGSDFGYASSKDLIHWSEPRAVHVMEQFKDVHNVWAPELFYDQASGQYFIFWASTVAGLYAETANSGDYNHRIYYVTTRDFQTFSLTKLLYDGGFNVIDADMFVHDGTYYLVVKNETKNPKAEKNLHLVSGPSPTGPWSKASPALDGVNWVEGPSVLRIADGSFLIYFDHYTNPHYYGALRSTDLKTWTNVSKEVSFPKGTRHGTALAVPGEVVEGLEKGERAR